MTERERDDYIRRLKLRWTPYGPSTTRAVHEEAIVTLTKPLPGTVILTMGGVDERGKARKLRFEMSPEGARTMGDRLFHEAFAAEDMASKQGGEQWDNRRSA